MLFRYAAVLNETGACLLYFSLFLSFFLSLAAIKKISLEPFDWIDTIRAKIYFGAQSYRGCAPACTYHATIVSELNLCGIRSTPSLPPRHRPSYIFTLCRLRRGGKRGDPSEVDIAREIHKSRPLSRTIDIFAINYRNIKFVFTSRAAP